MPAGKRLHRQHQPGAHAKHLRGRWQHLGTSCSLDRMGGATEFRLFTIALNFKKGWVKPCKYGRIVPLQPAQEEAKRVQMLAKDNYNYLGF